MMGGIDASQIILMVIAVSGTIALVAVLAYKVISKRQVWMKEQTNSNLVGPRILYESRESAIKSFAEEVRVDIYHNNYFPVKIKCSNCFLSGPLLVPRGERTDEELCPKCLVSALEVVGLSSNGEKPLYYPVLPAEVEERVDQEVERLVDEAWSLGQIRRREGMFVT